MSMPKKDNGVDLFSLTETWLRAQSDEAKTFELAPSCFNVKSFPRLSRSRVRWNCYNILV